MRSLYSVVSENIILLLPLIALVTGHGEDEIATCPVTQFRCDDGQCIPISWKCDIDKDCDDGSDEKECPPIIFCADDEWKCVTNGKCIPLRWTCDKDPDCNDDSDEAADMCDVRTCGPDQFQCDSGVCIQAKWKCDGTSDCKETDGEDEKDCEKACEGDMFNCDNGQCIAKRWYCDNDADCKDGSDEKNCPPLPDVCEDNDFQCRNGACIKEEWRCDGDMDCNDESDEMNCTDPVPSCKDNQFQCTTSKECIHQSWFCDHDVDCEDKSDENCNATCPSNQFMCTIYRYCLSNTVKCDGNIDCPDGTDEINCTTETKCTDEEFHCPSSSKCIARNLVCDGTNDCGNFEDESTELDCHDEDGHDKPCNLNNGGCEQVCVNLLRGNHRCDCKPGYVLMNGSSTFCDDVDECQDNHIHGTCSQKCINTKGSFKCECIDDYTIVNKRYCKADANEKPELLLVNRKDLRKINLENFAYNVILDNDHVHGAVAIDYHFEEKKFYWTDVKLKSIFRADFSDTQSVEIVINNTLNTPDGLAVDWINNHIYWTDSGLDRIGVASLDGKLRKTLIHTDLGEPRAIVLDPNHGHIYWTDWGEHPKIERSGMDGEDRETIVGNNVTWPNGLTIDYAAKRLYWIDAKMHTIESTNLDGTQRVTVLKSHLHLNHPFAITVFEDYLYWTDWPSESVRKFSKFGIGQVETIALDLHDPMDIHVLHPFRQQKTQNGLNFCGSDNGGCQHFCLPKAGSTVGTCVCANGYSLHADGKNCVEGENTGTVSTPVVPVTTKPDSPNSSNNRSSTEGNATCPSNQFMCTNTSDRICLSNTKKCDGNTDCTDGTDELNCTAATTTTATTVAAATTTTATTVAAATTTTTTTTSLKSMTHVPTLSDAVLLFLANDLHIVDLHNNASKVEMLRGFSANSLDVDVRRRKIYWTERNLSSIYSATLTKSFTIEEPEQIFYKEIQFSEGLALDWVHQNLYWSDSNAETISVGSIVTKQQKTLFKSDLKHVRGMAVDPNKGWLYWVSAGENPVIGMSGTDGSQRQILHDRCMVEPMDLALDNKANSLYWCDRQMKQIGRCNLKRRRCVVIYRTKDSAFMYSLDVYKKQLFWTDDVYSKVHKMNVNGRGPVSTVRSDLIGPREIAIFHKSRQHLSRNICGENNRGCQICLPTPVGQKKEYVCACPDNLVLQKDGKTCDERQK